jgi:hypothetical protein
MRPRCKYGLELPYNVADPFLNQPDRFFSLREMLAGVDIPRSPHGADTIAKRVKELGMDFVAYDLKPHDLDATVNVAAWARRNNIELILNNPACQINAAPTPGFQTWVYPPELLSRIQQEIPLLGLVYDELIHHQVHPGMTGHTNPWNAVADVTNCRDAFEAYQRIEAGLRAIFAHTAGTGIPAFTEQVVPALYHAVARAGGNPGCKVLKEQVTPISISLCISAAHQYHTDWFATVDLWEGDSGPWYQIMGRHSGHSPAEYLSALKLMALLNPYAAMTESADVLWVIDSPDAELTEFGETFQHFRCDLLPTIEPAFDLTTWQPGVAFVHAEDGCWKIADPPLQYDEPAPIYQSPRSCLLGAPDLAITPSATKWLRAWYHLTWGHCSGNSLHNYFSPLESAIARQNEVGGDEHDFAGCPLLAQRRDPSRQETHMHALFSPLNNVAVFDAYVTPEQLRSVDLIILCGSYCPAKTQAAVIVAVKAGARCLCQVECAPAGLENADGQRVGDGHWWTVPDFDCPPAMEQFLRFRGYPNQWILRSGLGLLRIFASDPWGNEIEWTIDKRE